VCVCVCLIVCGLETSTVILTTPTAFVLLCFKSLQATSSADTLIVEVRDKRCQRSAVLIKDIHISISEIQLR